ncbi:hypothetical protein CE91St38_12100 [Desulfovibrionaceae bacterium]|nr:hypothetical protein CE91St38_12100 [Desulfovibrionaceae bacterium]GKI11755.1 hypothetical protein CE91St39_12090 [Desulfovibrionaceae bacterium]
MLTKGAIGNLVNKYRAVLKKCGLLNIFGSLALAGALTVGAAGMAGAAVNWNDSVVAITSGTVQVTGPTDTVAASITIDSGGTLTLGSQGQDLWTTPGAGAADFSAPAITIKNRGTFTSSGGALQGIVPHDPWNYHGTLDAQQGSTITLTGGGSISALDITLDGTATIKGQLAQSPHPDNGAWRKDAMIYAGHDLTVGAHGNITLGDNGLIGAGTSNGGDSQQVNIQGSVTMEGSAQTSASVIRAFGDAALNISGTVGVATGKYGVIAAPVTNVDGGSITATGALEMVATLPDGKGDNAMTASTAGATFQSGELNLVNGGRLKAEAVAVKDGVINITGGVKGGTYQANGRSGIYDLDDAGDSGAVTLGGGTVNVADGGGIEVKTVSMTGGVLNVSGKGDYTLNANNEAWRNKSIVYGYGGLTVSGGTVNVGADGLLGVDYSSTNTANNMIFSDGTLNLAGTRGAEALLLAHDIRSDAGTTAATLAFSGATVNVNGDAIILAKEAAVSGGSLNVASGSHLLMRDGKPYGEETLAGAATAGLTVQNTTVGISGGAVNVKDGLTLNKDGKVNVSGGTLVVDGATTWTPVSGGTSGKLTISNGSVTLMESSILGAYDAGTQKYAVADQLTKNNALDTDKLGLSGGVLYLTRTESYTTAQLGAANTALNGSSVAFLGAKLETENATDVHINGTQTGGAGGAVTIASGNKTAIETGGAPITDVPLPDNSVAVTDSSKKLLTTNDITLNSSNTAGGLTVGNTNTDTAVKLTFDGNSTNTLVGVNGSLVQNEQGQAIITDAEVETGSTLNLGMSNNVNAQQVNLNNLTVAGTVVFDGNNDSTYSVAGKLNLSGQVNALNSVTTINELDGTGTLYVDPAYVSIATLTGGTLGATLLVGDGSVVNIGGMSGADLRTALAEAGMSVGPNLTLGDGQSALALTSPVTVSGAGKIVVDARVNNDGTLDNAHTTVNHQAYFGADSVLVVDASKLGADAAITSGTPSGAVTQTAVIAPDAHLQVVNATKGEVTLLDGFAAGIASDELGGTDFGWVKNSVANPDRMLTSTAAVDPAAGSVTLTNTVNKASDVLPGLDGELNPAMADVWDNAKNDVNAEARGVRFLSRAARADYIADARQAAVTIESAARMALVGAVPQMTMAASNAAGNAVTQRTGLVRPGGNAIQSMGTDGSMQTGASAGDAAKTGFAMWIMPLYQSSNGFGMKAGNFDMDFSGGLGGVAIGADYTFDNAIRAGITFNIGGGYAQGSGDLNETTNNMNFWGIGAYAGWTPGNFGLTADVNYTSTYNKLEQDLPASMQMGKLKSDVTAYAISAGLRGEYKIETSALDIIPHVGVRYMSLNTDEYDVKSGGTLLKGDAINQNIWTFPIGVAFSKQIETGNGWHFKPSLDLAVIPAAGDIDARSDVRFTGTGTKAELDTQTMDYVSYMGQAGLEFGNETTSLGVNYNIQLGAKSTAHGVFGTFRYEF